MVQKHQPSTRKPTANIIEPIRVPEWLIVHKAPRDTKASRDQSKAQRPANHRKPGSKPSQKSR